MRNKNIVIFICAIFSFNCNSNYTRGKGEKKESNKDSTVLLNVGQGFYYSQDSTGNNIYFFPGNTKSSLSNDTILPKIVWTAIPDVTQFGYNDSLILAISKSVSGYKYWHVDKREPTEEVGKGNNEERIILTNVYLIDSSKLVELQRKSLIKIEVK